MKRHLRPSVLRYLAVLLLTGAPAIGVSLASGASAAPAAPAAEEPGVRASPHAATVPRPPAGITSGRVIVLRPHRVDLVSDRVVQRVVPLPAGPVQFVALVRAIHDPRWVTLSGDGTATLAAAILQRPGTDLRFRAPVRRLRLVDSQTSPAYLIGNNAAVSFTGVAVSSSADAARNVDRIAPASAHRPYLRYVHNSTVTATSSQFDGLGAAAVGTRGVTVGSGSDLVATDSRFTHSGVGLTIAAVRKLALTRVVAEANDGAGIVVDRAAATHLADVATLSNGGSGLVLRGPLPGLTVGGNTVSSHNQRGGVEATRLGGPAFGGFKTDHNKVAGVILRHCQRCVLDGLEASAERDGVHVDRASTGVAVRHVSVQASNLGIWLTAPTATVEAATINLTGEGTGVRVSPAADHSTINDITVTGGAIGLSSDGSASALSDLKIAHARIAVRIGGTADQTVVHQLHASNAVIGLRATKGTRQVAVFDSSIDQQGGSGIQSAAAGLSARNVKISGATIGFDLHNAAIVNVSSVSGASEAVRAATGSRIEVSRSTLSAHVIGVRVAERAHLVLAASTVSAPLGARGPVTLTDGTKFPALPLHWLGAFALGALCAAICLELLHKTRQRRGHPRRANVAAHVTNIA